MNKDVEKTFSPKRGDYVLVSDCGKTWSKRIYVGYVENAKLPHLIVAGKDEGTFLSGQEFSTAVYRFVKPCEEEDKFAELKEAYKQGKKIQVKLPTGTIWENTIAPQWNPSYEYRIKPEPVYIPFTFEDREQLRGEWIKRKGTQREYLITSVSPLDLTTAVGSIN